MSHLVTCIAFGALFLAGGWGLIWGTGGFLAGIGLTLLLIGSVAIATIKE